MGIHPRLLLVQLNRIECFLLNFTFMVKSPNNKNKPPSTRHRGGGVFILLYLKFILDLQPRTGIIGHVAGLAQLVERLQV